MEYSDAKSLEQKSNELRRLCKLFDLAPRVSEVFSDTFYLELPQDQALACHLINAFEAYCLLKRYAVRVASERVTVPFDKLIKEFDKSYNDGDS